jgi:hypothetical protein
VTWIGWRQARAGDVVLITSNLLPDTYNLYFNVYKIIIELVVESRIVRAHPQFVDRDNRRWWIWKNVIEAYNLRRLYACR